MLRRSTCSLQRRWDVSLRKYSVQGSRAEFSKLLDFTIFQVEKLKQAASSTTVEPRLNGRASTQLNLFLSAMFYDDIPLSLKILGRLKRILALAPTSEDSANSVYFRCIVALLMHLNMSPESLTIAKFTPLVEILLASEHIKSLVNSKSDNIEVVKLKSYVLEALVHCYTNEANLKKQQKLLVYTIKVLEALNVTANVFSHNYIKIQLSRIKILEDFGLKLSETQRAQLEKSLATANQVTSLTFGGLLELIENRFQWENESKLPLYEVYERLPLESRSRFIEAYYNFNRRKQFEIESSCETIVPEFETKHSGNQQLTRFQITKAHMLYKWVNSALDETATIFAKKGNSDLESAILNNNTFLLKLIPLEEVMQIIVSRLVGLTLTLSTGSVLLLELSKQCSLVLKKYLLRSYDIGSIISEDTYIQISSTLIDIAVRNSKLGKLTNTDVSQDTSRSQEAFFYAYEAYEEKYTLKYKRNKVLKCNPILAEIFNNFTSKLYEKQAYLPMLVPPNPWTSSSQGGYLTNLKPIILTEDTSSYMIYLEKAFDSGQLTLISKTLNRLGELPWAINPGVLEILQLALKRRDGFLRVPPSLENIQLPEEGKTPNKDDFDSEDDYKAARLHHRAQMKSNLQEYHNRRSERFKYHYLEKFSTAFSKNGDALHIPYGFDFRGRIYPLTTVLNNHQEDLSRALMMFWYSKPLGPDGYGWLKYQLAGLYGMDKLPYHERVKWVDSNIENVRNTLLDPFKPDSWWSRCENPWQVLALCIEFAKIDKHLEVGGRIEDFKCRIPIHQDGSCNGLQHYAALGLDYEGGKAVNLVPTESGHREDIYSSVLDIVKTQVEADYAGGDIKIAKVASEFLSRKLVKQTVMTSVYGVTNFGAFRQIMNRIKEINNYQAIIQQHFGQNADIPKYLSIIVKYLTMLTLKSISSLFSKAKLIQQWLILATIRTTMSLDSEILEYKKSIAEAEGTQYPDFFDKKYYKPMMWTSLSGLPIIQQYKHNACKSLNVSTGSFKIKDFSKVSNINIRKQKNGIAPNYIHSIDSIHLQMTCIKATNKGLGFAAVHDSFWTYPNEVKELGEIIRNEFVTLHTSGIIENLKDDFQYTTRKSLQLVYVNKSEDYEFHSKLLSLRQDNLGIKINNTLKQQYNKILYSESEQFLAADVNSIYKAKYFELFKKLKPTLYFPISNEKMMIYNTEFRSSFNLLKNDISFLKYTPVLVPVQTLDYPPTGDLDINGVKQNEYFFS